MRTAVPAGDAPALRFPGLSVPAHLHRAVGVDRAVTEAQLRRAQRALAAAEMLPAGLDPADEGVIARTRRGTLPRRGVFFVESASEQVAEAIHRLDRPAGGLPAGRAGLAQPVQRIFRLPWAVESPSKSEAAYELVFCPDWCLGCVHIGARRLGAGPVQVPQGSQGLGPPGPADLLFSARTNFEAAMQERLNGLRVRLDELGEHDPLLEREAGRVSGEQGGWRRNWRN